MAFADRTLFVTGGAGFIGSNFVHSALAAGGRVVNLDLLTYAGNIANLGALEGSGRHHFVEGDICDRALVRRLFDEHRPDAVVHFAAESHVDRSIDGPDAFVRTNVVGTFSLLEEARRYLSKAPMGFRFVHVSTDEVFGSLGDEGQFREDSPYAPNSPYSASKAASDHFVRAYHRTYQLPTITTNCSNNYGPYQFPEKLVPLMILNCVDGRALPVYGTGKNVRDWIFVEDHCRGIQAALEHGRPGETYLFGGRNETTNLEMVETICDLVDEESGRPARTSRNLISFVPDRPGHDLRYAVDSRKAESELAWQPTCDLRDGLRRTVRWYFEHADWCSSITSGRYRRERLGLGAS